jgi:hypothetical protein
MQMLNEKIDTMKTEEWTLVLTAVQTIVIVLSFAALIWQLRQVARSLQQDAYSRAIEDYTEIAGRLLDKPQLNKFFYEDNTAFQALTDDEKDFYNYLGLSFALFERIYLLAQRGSIDSRIWASWERWLTDGWFRSRLFDTFWQNERTFFTTDFHEFVDSKYHHFKTRGKMPNQ